MALDVAEPAVVLLVLFAGVIVGLLSALFGVGGGILMVPFMVFILSLNQHVAEGTSLLVIVPTAIAGVISHHRRGYISYRTAIILALGGIGGAYLGAEVALRLDAGVLQAVFSGVLLVTGLRTVKRGVAAMKLERETG